MEVSLEKLMTGCEQLGIHRSFGTGAKRFYIYFSAGKPIAYIYYLMGKTPTLYVDVDYYEWNRPNRKEKRHMYIIMGEIKDTWMKHKEKYVGKEEFYKGLMTAFLQIGL